jgi:hypothetical protein
LQDVAMALDNKANTWDLDSKIVSVEYELYWLMLSFLKYELFTHWTVLTYTFLSQIWIIYPYLNMSQLAGAFWDAQYLIWASKSDRPSKSRVLCTE